MSELFGKHHVSPQTPPPSQRHERRPGGRENDSKARLSSSLIDNREHEQKQWPRDQ